ncbi:MAG TPA: macro domain-containing protein [Polyangia bacterium]|jgi:O-acetyl-ADP-ribose deacetylase (regulator of RNase III)
MEKLVNGLVLRLVRGDITDLDVEAFVYDARPDLVLGTGYGGAIAQRGGQEIAAELKPKGPLAVGEAVASGGGKLKAKHIIHTVGPKFQEPDEEQKLRRAVASALRCAGELGVTRLAFPPLGTGLYAVPLDVCARVLLEVVQAHAQAGTGLREVIVCAVDSREYQPFEARLKAL